jgi:hypothetical protein
MKGRDLLTGNVCACVTVVTPADVSTVVLVATLLICDTQLCEFSANLCVLHTESYICSTLVSFWPCSQSSPRAVVLRSSVSERIILT